MSAVQVKGSVNEACTTAKARPFLKWAGGKARMLPALAPHIPPTFGTYFEPFLGGGALFFSLQPKRAVLADANARLILTYTAVRDSVEPVIELLNRSPNDEAFFLKVRKLDVTSTDAVSAAAATIFLNKTCFNGLFRVNRSGQFNVPFGHYKSPTIRDAANLRACSTALSGTELVAADFEKVLSGAQPGDFVYLDPPYLPTSKTASFTGYTAGGFNLQDHRRLRDVALALKRSGVNVVSSNSAAPEIIALYKDGFEMHRVSAPRSVAASGGSRGTVEELLIV